MAKIEQTKTCTFDELKEHVEKLNKLLKNPALGLIAWCELYSFHIISKDTVCSKKDNFCKKLGLKIALNCALNSVISDNGTLLSDFVNSKATDVGTTSVVAKI